MLSPWTEVYLREDAYGGGFIFPAQSEGASDQEITYNQADTSYEALHTNKDWGSITASFGADDTARNEPFGATNQTLAAYYLNYYDGIKASDSTFADPNDPATPPTPMYINGQVLLGESDFTDDGSYLESVGQPEEVNTLLTLSLEVIDL